MSNLRASRDTHLSRLQEDGDAADHDRIPAKIQLMGDEKREKPVEFDSNNDKE
jgi:hypothetical protein